MTVISANYEKVLNRALNAILAPELTSRGYMFERVRNIATKVIPFWYEGIFSNQRANRILTIRYCPAGPNTKELLTCSISLLKYHVDEFDYTSSNHMSVPCTDISTIDKPLDEKFAQLFTDIREALVENFEEVLNGNRFEKKRFDWQDLK